MWTVKWHSNPSTHLVHLASDITEGLVCFFSFHISFHHHCPPLQIQDTLIVPLLVLKEETHGTISQWHRALGCASVFLPFQFSTFPQASSMLLSFPSLCQLYAVFKGSLCCDCLHVWKANQHKTPRRERVCRCAENLAQRETKKHKTMGLWSYASTPLWNTSLEMKNKTRRLEQSMSKAVSVYFSSSVNLPLNCLDISCKKVRYASLWNQLCFSEQCSMSGWMYKVTIRLWAACSELVFSFCQRLLNHLLSSEAERIFIRGTPKKHLSRVVFPTAEVSGMAGTATFTWACQKGKGTDDLSLAYGDTNKQDRFSRKLLQEPLQCSTGAI